MFIWQVNPRSIRTILYSQLFDTQSDRPSRYCFFLWLGFWPVVDFEKLFIFLEQCCVVAAVLCRVLAHTTCKMKHEELTRMDLVKFSVFWFFICLSFYLLFVGLVHGRNQFDCMLYQYELVFCSAKFPSETQKQKKKYRSYLVALSFTARVCILMAGEVQSMRLYTWCLYAWGVVKYQGIIFMDQLYAIKL